MTITRREAFGSLTVFGQALVASVRQQTTFGPEGDDRKPPELLLGSWGLVSFEQVLPSGEMLRPFGDSPVGLILYQAHGRMSAQLSVGRPARFASEDPDRASTEEAAEAWRTYFGYWGSFKVYPDKRVVVHRVEGSSFSNWIGTEQIRHFRFEGANRLILETQSSSGHYTLIWQRRLD
ncbi:MAG TPA: lipocalin-like domain-containing protein [Candidatus Acidoferrum sp.]|nr:lipocalin-like domain-containing protein [Candidatus Acidoferrum sp.]